MKGVHGASIGTLVPLLRKKGKETGSLRPSRSSVQKCRINGFEEGGKLLTLFESPKGVQILSAAIEPAVLSIPLPPRFLTPFYPTPSPTPILLTNNNLNHLIPNPHPLHVTILPKRLLNPILEERGIERRVRLAPA